MGSHLLSFPLSTVYANRAFGALTSRTSRYRPLSYTARRPMRHAALVWLGLSTLAAVAGRADEPPVPIGVGVVDITPSYPVRLVGYGNRKTESEGIEAPLKAKALAVGGDAEGPAILLAVDLLGVPERVSSEVAARLKARAGLPRERL